VDMDISMDIHETSVDMDMDVIFHIHGNPGFHHHFVCCTNFTYSIFTKIENA